MTITFHYSGDISHLAGNEREALLKELETCTRRRNGEYLGIVGTDVELEGSYDDEDGYCYDHEDMELVLNHYDVDWQGGATEPDIWT